MFSLPFLILFFVKKMYEYEKYICQYVNIALPHHTLTCGETDLSLQTEGQEKGSKLIPVNLCFKRTEGIKLTG